MRGIPRFKTKLCDMSANEGELNVEFVVEVEGFPKPSVHWFLGDVEITEKRTEYTRVEEGDNYRLIIKEVKTELRGCYTCKVQNEYGENSSSSNLTVNTRPKLLKKLADQRMKEGDTLKLTLEVSATPDPEVKWYKDGEEVTADARIKITRDSQRKESYDLTVTLLKGSDGGLYEVRAENDLGYVTSKSKVIVLSKLFYRVYVCVFLLFYFLFACFRTRFFIQRSIYVFNIHLEPRLYHIEAIILGCFVEALLNIFN